MLDPFVVPEERFAARVDGDAALGFLHAMLTQDLAALEPGRVASACYLDEKGRVLAPLRVIRALDGTVLIEAEEAARAAVTERLARVAPLSGCAIVAVPAPVRAIRGTPAALAGWAPLPGPGEAFARDDDIVVGVADPMAGIDVIGEGGPDVPVLDANGWERLRIDAGIPRFGVDVAESALINETPYLARAVSWTKGCYPGQESVARVANLGTIRRRLAILDTDGRLEPGAHVGGSGRVTSSADGVALAMIDASLEPGAEVAVDGGHARVRATL